MLIESFTRAALLIVHLDSDLIEIVLLSLRVTCTGILIATTLGLGLTLLLELKRIPAQGLIVAVLNTLTGLPPVVAGLVLYLFLSRSGPLGFLGLLYTPFAMIIAQTVLATPIVAALSHAAITSTGHAVRNTALGLGATQFQAVLAVFQDARYAIMAAVAAAFGRVMAEVGAVLMVGGNIAHHTRVMTTAIAMEADKGDFELAIALGLILLALSFLVNGVLYFFQRKGRKR
ncbi:MAG: ABC transporter permease [Desulfobulbaceae bacterium]|nr:ABC transporter permease [Desulfobulbaceae bacterium]